KGYESKHNLVYWNNENYYGFGAGASGYLDNSRYRNFGPIQHYLKPLQQEHLPRLENEMLSKKNQIEEEMFLGLRKTEGVFFKEFHSKFHLNLLEVYKNVIPALVQKNWITLTQEQIKLTRTGIFLGNEVFEKFLLD